MFFKASVRVSGELQKIIATSSTYQKIGERTLRNILRPLVVSSGTTRVINSTGEPRHVAERRPLGESSIPRDFRTSSQGKPRGVRVIGAVTSELNIIFSECRPLNSRRPAGVRVHVRVIGPIIAATWCPDARSRVCTSLPAKVRAASVRPISSSTGDKL